MPALLTPEQITESLKALPNWSRHGNEIQREFKLKDFATALDFVNKVGEKAEAADHHPDILIHGWNKVRITLSTHSAGGITDSDIKLAHTVDSLGY
ncbi:MAG: 4a-hydroxytetrahydrobiopterin dehydratase [Candidatus Sumerlaeaceae bacterium]|nr:4a-hydroxytetrahydrobiopterin dehydratase [Candidatus Sumerlaeaceae bacterium]